MSDRYQGEANEFHESDGWYFKRMPDGSVRIRVVDWPEGKVVREHVVASGPWCSVIATVSSWGETTEMWERAIELHGRGPFVGSQ